MSLIKRIDDAICERPGQVILAFLLVTMLFAAGLPKVSTEAGSEQFTDEIPAQEAFEAVQEEFSAPFSPDTGSSSLIQRGGNVLSKENLLRMLRAQQRLQDRDSQRVSDTRSVAQAIARTIDPEAATLDAQIDAIDGATASDIDTAVAETAERNPAATRLLSSDFNPESATASATIASVTHDIPGGLSSSAGGSAESPLTSIQLEGQRIVATAGGDIVVFGQGIISAEFGTVIADSLKLVVPGAVLFIIIFLAVAYRDILDLLLGIVALAIGLIWTLGLMGHAGIPFSQILISVPPLMLAVGIDFGIHAINRYREERATGKDIESSMRLTTDQLLVAFFIVTTTTMIGFSANLTSSLIPLRQFGVVASVGIFFTLLVFGIFLPALKVYVDRRRDRIPIPTISQRPLGSEGSVIGRALGGGVTIAQVAPVVFLVTVLLASGAAGHYATGIDTTFSNENFLPPEELPWYIESVPEPFAPNEYTVTEQIHFLEDNFDTSDQDEVTVYIEGPMERSSALAAIERAGKDPPETVIRNGRSAEQRNILTVIRGQAERDPEFRRLVRRNDRDGDGIPDQNLGQVYDALFATAPAQTQNYLTEDRRSTRVIYSMEADAEGGVVTTDARELASRHRFAATATGQIVVFQAVSDLVLESAVTSLSVALVATAIFLLIIYRLLEGYATLGLANLVPVIVTVTALAATMRALGMSFNAFTATILSLTIGLGIDYSVHVTHRFIDERRERPLIPALRRTVYGTGGALAGSMLTTVFGIGVLVLSIFTAIGQFGILTALSVAYAFIASLFVLPAALAVWDRLFFRTSPTTVDPDLAALAGADIHG
jgi:predicted RND superfamily exporter protein